MIIEANTISFQNLNPEAVIYPSASGFLLSLVSYADSFYFLFFNPQWNWSRVAAKMVAGTGLSVGLEQNGEWQRSPACHSSPHTCAPHRQSPSRSQQHHQPPSCARPPSCTLRYPSDPYLSIFCFAHCSLQCLVFYRYYLNQKLYFHHQISHICQNSLYLQLCLGPGSQRQRESFAVCLSGPEFFFVTANQLTLQYPQYPVLSNPREYAPDTVYFKRRSAYSRTAKQPNQEVHKFCIVSFLGSNIEPKPTYAVFAYFSSLALKSVHLLGSFLSKTVNSSCVV